MSFLNQLNKQAQSLQSQQGAQTQNLEALAAASGLACKTVWSDFAELPRQLSVIDPLPLR